MWSYDLIKLRFLHIICAISVGKNGNELHENDRVVQFSHYLASTSDPHGNTNLVYVGCLLLGKRNMYTIEL